MTCAICPSCAREHRDDARACTDCGAPLTLAVCAACEAINARDAASCHQCGVQFHREPWIVDVAPAPEADDVAESPVKDVAFVLDAVAPTGAVQPDADDVPGSPVKDVAFVLDAVAPTGAVQPDADDVIALGEKRYVGADARQHALADATPIAFAERAALALVPFTENDGPNDWSTPTPARRAHLGIAFAVVVIAGAVGYWAFDVPTLRGVVANSLARANAIAPLVAPSPVRAPVERADKQPVQASSPAHPNDAPVPEDPRSTLGLGTGDTATPTDAAPERAGNDSPSIEVPGTRDVQAERRTATKPRAATVKRPPSSRAHPQATPSRRADPGAVATTRLIERDLGRFLAK